jgi:hypothetical protein
VGLVRSFKSPDALVQVGIHTTIRGKHGGGAMWYLGWLLAINWRGTVHVNSLSQVYVLLSIFIVLKFRDLGQ